MPVFVTGVEGVATGAVAAGGRIAPVLARSHVLIAAAAWSALWWRPPGTVTALAAAAHLAAPLVGLPVTPADRFGSAVTTLLLVALGAVLPDLDHPNAWLAQRRLGRRGLLHAVRPFAFPSAVLREEFGHRGALHSLAAAAVLAGAGRLLEARWPGAAAVGAALAFGYALHLLADLLTRRGVPLLLPFWRGRWHLPWPLAVRTGSLGEAAYVLLVLLLAAAYALPGRGPTPT